MRKNIGKKKIILLVLLFLALLIAILSLKTNDTENIEKKLVNNGFKKDEYTEINLYTKDLSDISIDDFYDMVDKKENANYFSVQIDLDTYTISARYISYTNGIISYFIPKYEYRNDEYYYTYETIYNDKNISFDGSRENNNFYCDSSESVQAENKKDICNYVEENLNSFENYVNEEILNNNLLVKEKNKVIYSNLFKKISFIILIILSGITYLLYKKTNSDSI